MKRFAVLTIIQLVFFGALHQFFGLGYSVLTAFFLVGWSVAVAALLLAARTWWWKVVATLFVATIAIAVIVNAAYFFVFNDFVLPIDPMFYRANRSLVSLINDYVRTIPWYVFVGVALYVGSTLAVIWKRSVSSVRRMVMPVAAVVAIAALFVGSFYLDRHPRPGWWDRRAYLSDMTLAGLFVTRLMEDHPSATRTAPIVGPVVGGSATSTAPHILIYQLESVTEWPLHENPTPMPTFEGLRAASITAGRFFANGCHTVDAEFTSLCGAYGSTRGPVVYTKNFDQFTCLPKILKDGWGYRSALLHANTINFWSRDRLAPALGFEETYFVRYFKQKSHDALVLRDAIARMASSTAPTFQYVIGFTSHGPHNQEQMDYQKQWTGVPVTPFAGALSEKIKYAVDLDEETARNYLGFLSSVDFAIKDLFTRLEKQDLLKNTIVVIFGDHRYYGFKQDAPIPNLFYENNQIPFVMYVPSSLGVPRVVVKTASHIDVAPTILDILDRVTGTNSSAARDAMEGHSLLDDKFPNYAVSKCQGQSFYVDPTTVVEGSNGRYSSAAPEAIRDFLKNLVEEMDAILD